MQNIPDRVMAQFEAVIMKKIKPGSRHADYKKWLLYYFDFKSKYHLPDSRSEHVRLFIEKLREKNQTPEQQKQAYHAVSFYYGLLQSGKKDTPLNPLLVEGNYNDSHLYYVATPDDIRGQAPLDIQKIVGADLCV